MKKRSGPDLAPKKIETERCPDCAAGFTQGLLHRMRCFTCDGVGEVVDGAALPSGEAIVLLRMLLTEEKQKNAKLQLENSRLRSGESGRGYGAGGSRYHGD